MSWFIANTDMGETLINADNVSFIAEGKGYVEIHFVGTDHSVSSTDSIEVFRGFIARYGNLWPQRTWDEDYALAKESGLLNYKGFGGT